jgi:hypothetical protein
LLLRCPHSGSSRLDAVTWMRPDRVSLRQIYRDAKRSGGISHRYRPHSNCVADRPNFPLLTTWHDRLRGKGWWSGEVGRQIARKALKKGNNVARIGIGERHAKLSARHDLHGFRKLRHGSVVKVRRRPVRCMLRQTLADVRAGRCSSTLRARRQGNPQVCPSPNWLELVDERG